MLEGFVGLDTSSHALGLHVVKWALNDFQYRGQDFKVLGATDFVSLTYKGSGCLQGMRWRLVGWNIWVITGLEEFCENLITGLQGTGMKTKHDKVAMRLLAIHKKNRQLTILVYQFPLKVLKT